jgi:hypothetical protein
MNETKKKRARLTWADRIKRLDSVKDRLEKKLRDVEARRHDMVEKARAEAAALAAEVDAL